MGKIKEIIDEILETTSAHNYRAKNAVLASAELTALIERAEAAERERDEARAENEIKQAMYDGLKDATDQLSAELERVKQERDSAQHFLSRIIEHCDDDGIMADDTTINLVAARKAAGIQEP